jgi:hypothetical protein
MFELPNIFGDKIAYARRWFGTTDRDLFVTRFRLSCDVSCSAAGAY